MNRRGAGARRTTLFGGGARNACYGAGYKHEFPGVSAPLR